MPSTYTTNSGLEKPGAGEQSGTWGSTVNTNYDMIDRALNGVSTVSIAGTSSTITTNNGAVSDGLYKVLVLTGSPSATHTITVAPSDAQKLYFVNNTTSQSVVFTQGAGTADATVGAGESAVIYADGSDECHDLGGLFPISASVQTALDAKADGSVSIVAGGGITIDGTDLTGDITISHTDTATVDNLTTGSRRYIAAMTFDTYGHVTGYSTGTETVTDTTYTASSDYGMDLSGTEFRLANDRRRNATNEDVYSGNSHDYTFYDQDVGIRWYTANEEDMRLTDAGDLHVDGDITAFSTTISDERLKSDIELIGGALDKVSQLNGYTFKYIADGRKSAGVIAQEVEKVLPSAVTEKIAVFHGEDGEKYKVVHYDQLHGLLIEAIKELKSEIEALKDGIR